MTRYLLTGATGFVGGRLAAMIARGGGAVTALARPSPAADALARSGIDVVHGDLATGRGLPEAVRGADRVVHLAAAVKARTAARYLAVNRDGTARLVDAVAALPHPPRLVVCSSLAAAGPSAGTRAGSGPVSWYGASKLAAEQEVRRRADRIPAIVLRPGIVYGPGDPALLPALLPMVRAGVVVKAGLGPRRYCLVHVDDLCAALLAACERGATLCPEDRGAGVYPLCDGTEHTWEQFCSALAGALGRPEPLVLPVPMAAVHAVAALSQAAGRLRGTVPAFNRDKAHEMAHPAWTCTPADGARPDTAGDLGLGPALSLRQGLAATLAHWPKESRCSV